MNLAPGARLDHYEILEMIGKGGMGEVYRAKDTRLPREVAVKVSVEQFSERFAREAKIIASLNHPNICTLFDVGPNYLVMEMVEGPTLADRIKEGALSLDQASGIAKEIPFLRARGSQSAVSDHGGAELAIDAEVVALCWDREPRAAF